MFYLRAQGSPRPVPQSKSLHQLTTSYRSLNGSRETAAIQALEMVYMPIDQFFLALLLSAFGLLTLIIFCLTFLGVLALTNREPALVAQALEALDRLGRKLANSLVRRRPDDAEDKA